MKSLVFCSVLLICGVLSAQNKDVFQSVNELVKETQRVISIEKGQVIDTAYFRTLFLPTAHFSMVGQEDGEFMQETMGLDEFLATLTDEYYSNGYHEAGMGAIVEEYNGMAQVIQSFEGMDSENETGKGVNSFQFVYSEGRWWIANMVWAMSYDNGKDIPRKYLKKN
ncbi:hypothetical protein [Flagellimonas zhangzhouensis]|uniref:DUF4440 domain-containing protein n=1 Tax=Flagellimonas zhangzhouensis TaxID=1073328 RepID=A0A1H2SHS7_9FLAO|nr:hypothetical protein [Allomuricauda zhangzhouensis]SDQ74816.1 hypothetical protein SAMN05216294_2454 [Allomuricauda zhangzhouensis]SDW31045.1 hypothetical protein SAMN04487892_1098 [Allomuricauda zhangzhouensis]